MNMIMFNFRFWNSKWFSQTSVNSLQVQKPELPLPMQSRCYKKEKSCSRTCSLEYRQYFLHVYTAERLPTLCDKPDWGLKSENRIKMQSSLTSQVFPEIPMSPQEGELYLNIASFGEKLLYISFLILPSKTTFKSILIIQLIY